MRGARLNARHVGAAAPLRAALARLAALLRREDDSGNDARGTDAALHVLHWPPGRAADAASGALLRQLGALMGCAVRARGGEGDGSAGSAHRDAFGDLYFARGALRGWDAAHAVPFAPSRRAWRRRDAADGPYSAAGGGDDDSPPGTPLAGAAAAAAAAARLAAVRAYHDAAVDAINNAAAAAPPAPGAPRPRAVPLLVLDNLSYEAALARSGEHGGGLDPDAWAGADGGGGATHAWSPAPHAPRAPGRHTPEQVRAFWGVRHA